MGEKQEAAILTMLWKWSGNPVGSTSAEQAT